MSENEISNNSPFPVEVEAGKSYYWCQCGQSENQPFCDGSHTGTDILPVPFSAQKNETLYFCGCKATKHQPLCDGSHQKLG